jgi:hypothetical protein
VNSHIKRSCSDNRTAQMITGGGYDNTSLAAVLLQGVHLIDCSSPLKGTRFVACGVSKVKAACTEPMHKECKFGVERSYFKLLTHLIAVCIDCLKSRIAS